MTNAWALALHGGAGPIGGRDLSDAEAHMAETLRAGAMRLERGDAAFDVVHDVVQALEACGHHLAGKGSAPNRDGRWELDAAIMDGGSRRAGAVAALRGYKSPVAAARAVMERTEHVLIVGKGAARVARDAGLERVWNPQAYYTPSEPPRTQHPQAAHGTVGAVALDRSGRLASATSTGGVRGKTPGRVGDSPLIGSGTWADERVAVSCTGAGEYFMRTAAAADVSARIRYGAQSLGDASKGAMEDMALLGGDGGLIAVDVLGNLVARFNAEGMKRGLADWKGRFEVALRP